MTTITPCLWFDGNAEEAVNFYVSVLPDAHIDRITRAVVETPGNKPGSVLLIEFTLAGRPYQALNGGASFPFTEAISLSLLCDDQAEVDRLWSALTADGGMEVQCGWLKDKYGLCWQIVPKRMMALLNDPDKVKVARAMQAMMSMVKLDIAALEAAFHGR